MKLGQIARLAGADLRHDRLVSLCMVASLVAVIAPLLLLFGLKHGVISTMRDQLLNDPHNLEIRLLNSGSYDQTWVDALAQHPQAGFVIGLTRSLNTQADLLRSGAQFLENADVLPTASGDPLMAGLRAPAAGAVVLSAQAATRDR
ncbi:ABC transporter permease, partial [Bordetella avium]